MMLDNNAADILSLDAGEVFIGGRYNSLLPLMQQLFEGIILSLLFLFYFFYLLIHLFFFIDGSTEYYSVALVKKNTLNDVYNIGHLQGKKACFAAVGTQAGWNVPINTVISIII